MNNEGLIRKITPEEPIRHNEIGISQWAKNKLKKMPISLRLKWKTLKQKGFSEKNAFRHLLNTDLNCPELLQRIT